VELHAVNEAVFARARAGQGDAFEELTAPYRRELQVHCYRMLGSLHDAEDAVQETMVAAWRGLGDLQRDEALRPWLYRIATNRCLNLLRAGERRPRSTSRGFEVSPPPPTRLTELTWFEPYPDALLDGVPDEAPGPDAVYEMREALGLAFLRALMRLPERQRAVLVLRDVLGFRATEVASMLEVTEATVNSALVRAREAVAAREGVALERVRGAASASEQRVAFEFAEAFQDGDMDRVVAMLTDDAWVTMPPEPLEYQGRDVIAGFLDHVTQRRAGDGGGVRRARLVVSAANRQPAVAHYIEAEAGSGVFEARGLFVLKVAGDRVAELTRFGGGDLVGFCGLPMVLSP
jgi:RNA polymerase sigma-70 factor (TIGR02960 family)